MPDEAPGRPRILIVRLGSLGDIVHGIPVAAALRARFAGARLDWLVDPRYVDLLRLVPAVDRIVPVDPRRAWRALPATMRALRRTRYDAAIDLQGLLKSAVLARAAGAVETIGFPRAHLREPLARVCYSRTTEVADGLHVVYKNLALLGALGLEAPPAAFPIAVPRTAVVEQVEAAAGPAGYALISPGAGWPNKRWPPPRFGALAVALRERIGLPSVVLWGPGEGGLATAVVASSNGAAQIAPPTAIPDVVGLAGGARVMVAGDTGPLHVAAAVGTPVVALFGPSRAERNGPWRETDVTVARTAQCECLYQRRCRRRRPCLEAIGVEDVVAAVEHRLRSARLQPGPT